MGFRAFPSGPATHTASQKPCGSQQMMAPSTYITIILDIISERMTDSKPATPKSSSGSHDIDRR